MDDVMLKDPDLRGAGTFDDSHGEARQRILQQAFRALDQLPMRTLAHVADLIGQESAINRNEEARPTTSGYGSASGRMPQGVQGLTLDTIEAAFTYQPWDRGQVEQGDQVREALIAAAKTILRVVSPSPSRTRALNALVDARLHANTAITWRGVL